MACFNEITLDLAAVLASGLVHIFIISNNVRLAFVLVLSFMYFHSIMCLTAMSVIVV